MHNNLLTKKNREFLLFSSTLLLIGVVFLVAGQNSQLFHRLASADSSYTITLDEYNSPENLNESEFGNGSGYGRYVAFDYTNAKLANGSHVVLKAESEDSVGGFLSNNIATRITAIKSITAIFSGGQATLETGPTQTTLGSPQVLTTTTPIGFISDPYFFCLTNTGESDLVLTSLAINYSCIDTLSTIEFATNGGPTLAPIRDEHGAVVSEPVGYGNAGYIFEGWFTEPNFLNEYTFTTMPDNDVILYAKWSIDNSVDVLSIGEYKGLVSPDSEEVYFATGIVLLANSNMDLTVICDGSGTLIVFGFGFGGCAVGDEVRVGGYYGMENGLVVLNPSETRPISVDVLSYDNVIPLAPTVMTIASYNALDPDLSANWVVFAEINGTINANDTTHQITLTSGSDTITIGVFEAEDYYYLRDYSGLRVNFRGIILPNMDSENTVLMFMFNSTLDFVELDYEGEDGATELYGLIEPMFRDAFESPTYFPGQFVDLPESHDVIPVTLTYVPFGVYADKFNPTSKRVANDAGKINIDVEVDATLTLYDPVTAENVAYESSFNIVLKVDPDIIISVAEAKAMSDSYEVTYVIQCVVLNIQPQGSDMLLLVADNTGMIYINTNDESIVVGDEVVAIGHKVTMGTHDALYNEPQRTVDHVVATGQSMPMTATPISMDDFSALAPEVINADFYYYELSGTLNYTDSEHPDTSMFYLSLGEDYVFVYPTSVASRTILTGYVGQSVTARGIAIMGGDTVILGFLPVSGCIAENPM